MPNLVEIGQTAAEIWRFFDFSKMAAVRHRTTHEGHLVVFIAVQNLVGIDAAVLIICMFWILRLWLENAYSRSQNWGFWWILPPKWGAM